MRYRYNGTGKIRILGRVLEKGETIEVSKENEHFLNNDFNPIKGIEITNKEIKKVAKEAPKGE